DDELYNLSIRKGSLNDEERKIIEGHASLTNKMLEQLPFPKKLANVASYASGHHEKLDGTGYPLGLKADELPLQAKIMAIADVFEALTAGDRPYKQPMKLSQAVKILGFMKNDKHIDPDIFDLFIKEGIFQEYANIALRPEQIDELQ
ncbi:MAG: HD domain-containing phosphohydrolase, partial [bacterium]|nr:HD domain-containing phosphohydrolase [bacterium]